MFWGPFGGLCETALSFNFHERCWNWILFFLAFSPIWWGSVKVQALIDAEHQVTSQPQVTTSAPSSVSLILFFPFFMTTLSLLGVTAEAFPSPAILGFDTLLKSTFVVLLRCPDTTTYYQKTSIGLDWATFTLTSSYCGTCYGLGKHTRCTSI